MTMQTPDAAPESSAPAMPEGRASPAASLAELCGAVAEAEVRVGALAMVAAEALDAEDRELIAAMQQAQRALLARLHARLDRTPALPQLPQAPERKNDGTGQFRVLLVEDDPTLREALRELLHPWFVVIEAADGAEAVARWEAAEPDVVVTDLCMPLQSGFDVVETLRKTPEGTRVPVIFLSGMSDPQVKVRAFESGAFDYLVKPVDARELVARIRNALIWSEHVKREHHLQMVDELTGLGNRRRMTSFLSERLRAATGAAGEMSVLMVDQDDLKGINDTHGHAAGDAALRALGEALCKVTRAGDLVARIGGDEFVVVLPGACRRTAEAVAARAREVLSKTTLEVSSGVLRLSASFGVASTADVAQVESPGALLERADAMLYQEKRKRVRPGSTRGAARSAGESGFGAWSEESADTVDATCLAGAGAQPGTPTRR